MAEFSRELVIAAEPAVVLAFALNPRNASKITPQVLQVVQVPDGPIGVGTILRETRRQGGRTSTTDVEIIALDWQQGFAARADVGGIVVTYTYRAQAVPAGCDLSLHCEVTGRGLKKIMVPVVAKVMEKMDGDQLERLKKALKEAL